MLNQILERQKQDNFLEYLVAQRQLYWENKHWTTIWIVATTIIAVVVTGLVPSLQSMTALVALVSVLMAASEFVVLRVVYRMREDAAAIQEVFDCELLELPWNGCLTDRPASATILLAKKRFSKRPHDEREWKGLRKWYDNENLGDYPLERARILCQNENIQWDARQRRKYARVLLILSGGVALLLVLIGLALRLTVAEWFAGPILLGLPVASMLLKQADEHCKASTRLDKMSTLCNGLWHDACQPGADPAAITQRTRDLQNEIYHHRSETPPVPDWLYKRYKNEIESIVNLI